MEIAFIDSLAFLRFDGMICVFAVALIAVLGSFSRRSAGPCSRCGMVSRPRAKFCAQCGQSLAD